MKQKILESPKKQAQSEFADRYVGAQLRAHTEQEREDVLGTRTSGRARTAALSREADEGERKGATQGERRGVNEPQRQRSIAENEEGTDRRPGRTTQHPAITVSEGQKAAVAGEEKRAATQPEKTAQEERQRLITPHQRVALQEAKPRVMREVKATVEPRQAGPEGSVLERASQGEEERERRRGERG